MSYPFVGYYTCYYDNFPNTKDQVYLYVNGKQNHANTYDSITFIVYYIATAF